MLTSYTYTPEECTYDILFEAKTLNGEPGELPGYVSFDDSEGFTLLTNNPLDYGSGYVELTA